MPKISSIDLQVLNKIFDSTDPTDSQLVVTIDPAQPLTVGSYVFQLEVEDESGNRSAPAVFKMAIVDTTAPNALIDGSDKIPFNTAFTLSGKRSFDVGGGHIERFHWTRIQ
jgi:hypothetical protein